MIALNIKSFVMKMTSYLCVAGIAIVGTASISLANSQDLQATVIPASACHPEDNTSAELGEIIDGSWTFKEDSFGSIQLWCPLSVTHLQKSNPYEPNTITTFRVLYQKSGLWALPGAPTTQLHAAMQTRVRVRMVHRYLNNFGSIMGNWWNSPLSITRDAWAIIEVPDHQLVADRFYGFTIQLIRQSSIGNPTFSGIDFRLTPVG